MPPPPPRRARGPRNHHSQCLSRAPLHGQELRGCCSETVAGCPVSPCQCSVCGSQPAVPAAGVTLGHFRPRLRVPGAGDLTSSAHAVCFTSHCWRSTRKCLSPSRCRELGNAPQSRSRAREARGGALAVWPRGLPRALVLETLPVDRVRADATGSFVSRELRGLDRGPGGNH